MAKGKAASGGGVQVKAHSRNGKSVKAHSRGSGGRFKDASGSVYSKRSPLNLAARSMLVENSNGDSYSPRSTSHARTVLKAAARQASFFGKGMEADSNSAYDQREGKRSSYKPGKSASYYKSNKK